jgi:hypothetical protein
MSNLTPKSADTFEKEVKSDWSCILEKNTKDSKPTKRAPCVIGKDIILLDNYLTPTESRDFINSAEQFGFGSTHYPKHYRGNLRLISYDENLAINLWERMRSFVPLTVEEDGYIWEARGLNHCWRLSKYFPGDRFRPHCDTSFQQKINPEHTQYTQHTIKSMYTVNIYLNGLEDFLMGCTRFLDDRNDDGSGDGAVVEASVVPSAGLCLIFRQPPFAYYLHEGEEVKEGCKFLMRSDVMYTRTVQLQMQVQV